MKRKLTRKEAQATKEGLKAKEEQMLRTGFSNPL